MIQEKRFILSISHVTIAIRSQERETSLSEMESLTVKLIIIYYFHPGKVQPPSSRYLNVCHKLYNTLSCYNLVQFHDIEIFRCAQCDGAILDQCVSALDKTWHPEHFVCASCSNPFGVSRIYIYNRLKLWCMSYTLDAFLCNNLHDFTNKFRSEKIVQKLCFGLK